MTHLGASIQDKDYSHHNLIMSTFYTHFDMISCLLSSVLHGEPSSSAIHPLHHLLKHTYRTVRIVGSVNGLVCIAIEEAALFLWNPSTRKSKRLPHSRKRTNQDIIYGFGYDNASSEYKVVDIYCKVDNQGSNYNEVQVYGLNSNSWRNIGDFPNGALLDDSGKFVSGSLQWETSSEMGLNYSQKIVAFNLSKENYSEIPEPYFEEGITDSILGALDGCLSMLCNFDGIKAADVWVMKEYGKVWSKLFSILHLSEPENFQYSDFQYPVQLFMSRENDVLLVLGSLLFFYNIDSNTVRHPDYQNLRCFLEVDTYIESLVSPE